MALVGYFIVFSFVTKPGQTLEFLLWGTIVPLNFLVGYHCSIVASTPQPMAYASTHCTHGTCGVLHCLLFCDQTRPNLRISLVGYHCSIEFPCGVPLFYCCKYPTTYGVRVHPHTHKLVNTGKRDPPIVPLLFIHFRNTSHMFCTRLANGGLFPTGDPIVPFVILSPRFECLNKLTHTTHTHKPKYRTSSLGKLSLSRQNRSQSANPILSPLSSLQQCSYK